MDSFLFALKAVSPIILLVFTGYLLKKIGLITPDFAKQANKLVFRIFLPAMLFLNVYKIENIKDFDFGYVLYAVVAIALVFTLAVISVIFVTNDSARRGALLQNSFRSNFSIIGLPLAISLFGSEGGAAAAVLSVFSIPTFNILAVVSLSVFQKNCKKPKVSKILLNIAKNPLIISIILGVVMLLLRAWFVNSSIDFRLSSVEPIYKVIEALSQVATPLSLIALGAQFEFSAISGLKREIIVGTLTRVVFVPLICIGCAYLLFRNYFTGAHFAAYVALFASPVAVSSVPMAQEMDSDATLAGQLVVWTTIFSSVTIFLYTYILSLLGIFPV